MRAGLVISTTLHAALLGYGLLALSAPHALEVADVEAFPVDIVPVESITQIQQGDRKAPKAEQSAPIPTRRPDPVPDARNVGENSVDQKSAPTPEPKPREVKAAEAPPPSPEPAKQPAEEPAEAEAKAEAQPVPATEVTPQPQPKQDVKPEPVEETAVAENAEAEAVELPDSMPLPQARPKPPQAQTAKAPERKQAEKPAEKKAAERPKSEEPELDLDDIAALLNKERPSGGGAKRSTEQAALGGQRTTEGQKLSQSEMDALRGQIQRCWNIPAGALDAENLKVSVQFRLDKSGALESAPQIVGGAGGDSVQRAAAESARRAILQCAPYNLPTDKYEAWAEVIVNFDPSEMF